MSDTAAAEQDAASKQAASDAQQDESSLTILHKGVKHTYTFTPPATVSDLCAYAESTLNIPPSNQKFLVAPKPGLLKPPFDPASPNGSIPLTTLQTAQKITLLGSTSNEVDSLNQALTNSTARQQARTTAQRQFAAKPTTARRDIKTLHDSTTYTFLTLRPLPYLPNPDRSLRFLERLRDDPGIKAAMAAHRFTVPLLTEMNPAEHTTHESRTLGLNRNGGEVIELRLRTDAYDGYRDYKTIRKTLCHELAHNVHGDHDAKFWALCRQIEGEVDRADWRSGGRVVGVQEFYEPEGGAMAGDEDFHVDHGAWTGGEYVLGSGGESAGGGTASSGSSEGLSRREILARAAEERAKKAKEERSSQSQ